MAAVGPFDESLRRTEDVDLGLRFQIAGRTAVYDEEMSVTHIDGLGGAPSAEEKLVIEQEEVHRMATAYPSAATHLYRTTSQPFRELAVLHRFRSQLAASK